MNNLWQVIDQTRAGSRNKDFEFDMKIWKLTTLAAHSYFTFNFPTIHASSNITIPNN